MNMGNLQGFDASTVQDQTDYSALPADKYTCMAVNSEVKTTNAGTGKYLNITFEVIDGKYAGRKLWSILNLWNPNEQAVQIAQRELGALCKAVGVLKPNDSSELHNRPVLLTVGIEQGNKGERNVVKRYDAVAPGATPAAAPAAKPAGSPAAAPWAR